MTVRDHEIAAVEFTALDVIRWSRVRVPIGDARSLAHVSERVCAAVESGVAAEADGRLLVIRVVLEGRTDLHARLTASTDAILAEARAAALGLGEGVAWLEKVEAETLPLSESSPTASNPALSQILAEASNDEELHARLEVDLGELTRRSPHELRDEADDAFLTAVFQGEYAGLAAALSSILSEHLDV